jgi:cytochrome c553
MMRPLTIAASLALAAAAATAFARQDASALEPPAPAARSGGDAAAIERGRQLAYTCQGCHGIPGYRNVYPHFHVPKIGGQPRQYLVNALQEYKAGDRSHPTMQAQAQSFSDADIADIAAFLSSLQP